MALKEIQKKAEKNEKFTRFRRAGVHQAAHQASPVPQTVRPREIQPPAMIRSQRPIDNHMRRRFPEASSSSRQLQLLVKGCMPMVRQKMTGLMYRVRSFLSKLAGKVRETTFTRRAIQTTVFLAAGLALMLITANRVLYTTATTLTFDGQELGTVASEEEAQAAVARVERAISQKLGSNYNLEPDKVSYTTGITYRGTLMEESDLEEALSQSLRVLEHGYALFIDGEMLGATQSREAFEELLYQVSANFRNENTVSIDFVEGVDIIECDLPVEEFTNLSEIALRLNSLKDGEVTYTVEAGDCWSVIAQDHNMDSADLLRLNPGYDIDRLNIGDVLVISNAVPYLTVRATQMEYYEEEIPYEVEYRDDPTMWEGDTRVITKGAYGLSNTVARVTYEDVTEVEREIVSRDIFLEPVTEVQARGTMERPTWAPTGSFRWPCSGSLSSRYGYRSIFGGSSFHGGIDIANSYGTDVVAADGGIVIYAGWNSGGYGNLVQIDHQNGYVTYYAHNSSLLVSVGDKVFKGQHIAEMGSTGRSTGNHCHFEVRINGERANPLNYLP